ncbi:MAG: hypothetical protein QOK12_1047 [Mycobacterium sp.]|nr:hypothetical protein [Mycobacterium sp.]
MGGGLAAVASARLGTGLAGVEIVVGRRVAHMGTVLVFVCA